MPAIATLSFEVKPSDIDVLEHVNNRVYLRWIEAAALEATAQNGWPAERYFSELGCAWVAREHWVEYLRPCVLGDRVDIYTWVSSLEGARTLRRYAILNAGKLSCIAATEWAFVNLDTRRMVECPEAVAAAFEIVPDGDSRLRDLGIRRSVRFSPLGLI